MRAGLTVLSLVGLLVGAAAVLGRQHPNPVELLRHRRAAVKLGQFVIATLFLCVVIPKMLDLVTFLMHKTSMAWIDRGAQVARPWFMVEQRERVLLCRFSRATAPARDKFALST